MTPLHRKSSSFLCAVVLAITGLGTASAAILEQIAPGSVLYIDGIDYFVMDESAPGDVTAAVTSVDLQLGLGNTATSGCEAADFAGFPAGNIALVQRGTCTFELKAENAAAAAAVGVLIFNQGNTNTAGRLGLFAGTLSDNYTGGIPVMSLPYQLGADLSVIAGLTVHMQVTEADLAAPEPGTLMLLALGLAGLAAACRRGRTSQPGYFTIDLSATRSSRVSGIEPTD